MAVPVHPQPRALSRAPRWIKPDSTASTDVDVEERRVREAPYPCKKPRTLHEEALDVGAVDVRDSKVERPSLRVACGAEAFLRVRVAVDDGHRSTRKRLGERCRAAERDRHWASRSARWFGLA